MYGTNLQLITLRCRVCRRWVALRVDPDNLLAFNEGMYIQDACPYLRQSRENCSSARREVRGFCEFANPRHYMIEAT